MKHHLTTLTICLLLCAQAFAAAADKPNNLIIYAADRFLVEQGLLTGEPTLTAPATSEKYTPASNIWPDRKLQEVEEKNGHHLEFKDMWAPIVIQMGRASDYKSYEAFQAAVKFRKFEYEDGKLTYESEAKDSYEYWAKGTQLPRINGAPVNLNPKKTYDSPFLSMEHGSNRAVIHRPGYKDEVLDFGS